MSSAADDVFETDEVSIVDYENGAENEEVEIGEGSENGDEGGASVAGDSDEIGEIGDDGGASAAGGSLGHRDDAGATASRFECCICRDDETEEDNPLLLCDGGCGHSAHLTCYGVLGVPDGEWHCFSCRETAATKAIAPPPACVLCGAGPEFGFLKTVKGSGAPIHVLCALVSEGVHFDSVMRMDGAVLNDAKALADSRSYKCYLCGTRGGTTIRCRTRFCKTTFHPKCAAESGLRLELRAGYVDGRAYAFCGEHQDECRPPPRPEGFREENIAGLFDGIGVCNRKRWAEKVDWEYATAAAPPVPGSKRGTADNSERDRIMTAKEDRERGLGIALSAAAAALVATRAALARHERIMAILASAAHDSDEKKALRSGGYSDSALPHEPTALEEELGRLDAGGPPGSFHGSRESFAEGAAVDGLGSVVLLGRAADRWKACGRAFIPESRLPSLVSICGPDATASDGGLKSALDAGAESSILLPWPPASGLPKVLEHSLLGKVLKGRRRRRAEIEEAEKGGESGDEIEGAEASAASASASGAISSGPFITATDEWLSRVQTSGAPTVASFTLAVGPPLAAESCALDAAATSTGIVTAPTTYLRVVLPPPAEASAGAKPLVEFPFCEEDEDESDTMGIAACGVIADTDYTDTEDAGAAAAAAAACLVRSKATDLAVAARVVSSRLSARSNASLMLGILRPSKPADEVEGELWAAVTSLSTTVKSTRPAFESLRARHAAALEADALALRAEVESLAIVRLAALLRSPCGRTTCPRGVNVRCRHRAIYYERMVSKARSALRRLGGIAAIEALDASGRHLDAFAPRWDAHGAPVPRDEAHKPALETWGDWKSRWASGYSLIDAAAFPPHMLLMVLRGLLGVATGQAVASNEDEEDVAPRAKGGASKASEAAASGGKDQGDPEVGGAPQQPTDRLVALLTTTLHIRENHQKLPKFSRSLTAKDRSLRAKHLKVIENAREYVLRRTLWMQSLRDAARVPLSSALRASVDAQLSAVGSVSGSLQNALASGTKEDVARLLHVRGNDTDSSVGLTGAATASSVGWMLLDYTSSADLLTITNPRLEETIVATTEAIAEEARESSMAAVGVDADLSAFSPSLASGALAVHKRQQPPQQSQEQQLGATPLFATQSMIDRVSAVPTVDLDFGRGLPMRRTSTLSPSSPLVVSTSHAVPDAIASDALDRTPTSPRVDSVSTVMSSALEQRRSAVLESMGLGKSSQLSHSAGAAVAREVTSAVEYLLARIETSFMSESERKVRGEIEAEARKRWGIVEVPRSLRGGGPAGVWGDAAAGEAGTGTANEFQYAGGSALLPDPPSGAPRIEAPVVMEPRLPRTLRVKDPEEERKKRALYHLEYRRKRARLQAASGGASGTGVSAGSSRGIADKAGSPTDDTSMNHAVSLVADIFDELQVKRRKGAAGGAKDTAADKAASIVASQAKLVRPITKDKNGIELFCTCRTPHDGDREYIACDTCDEWFHLSCVQLSSFASNYLILSYACARCSKSPLKPATLVRTSNDPKLQDAMAALAAAQLPPELAARFHSAMPKDLVIREVPPAGLRLTFKVPNAVGETPRLRLRRSDESGGWAILRE